jgi:hypothetical protein
MRASVPVGLRLETERATRASLGELDDGAHGRLSCLRSAPRLATRRLGLRHLSSPLRLGSVATSQSSSSRAARRESSDYWESTMSYAQDRLYVALYALVGASPIRDRLISAAHAMLTIDSKDFSNADEAQTFVKLWRDLTDVEGGCGGADEIESCVKRLTDDDAVRLARTILNLYDGLDPSGPYPTPEFPLTSSVNSRLKS